MNLKLIKTLIRAMELDNGNHTTQLAAIIAAELGHGPAARSLALTKPSLEVQPDEIVAGIKLGKLEAVKRYKNRTGSSLLDAKKKIEEYFDLNNLRFYIYSY